MLSLLLIFFVDVAMKLNYRVAQTKQRRRRLGISAGSGPRGEAFDRTGPSMTGVDRVRAR